MRLRSRPLLFSRVFVDAATIRPFLRDLLELRRASGPVKDEPTAPTTVPSPVVLPTAA